MGKRRRKQGRAAARATGVALDIRFVRKQGQRDTIYVRRDDGWEVSWVFPNFGEGLPHDLVHLVVERAFGLRDGFWGLVAQGVDFGLVNAVASHEGGKDKYRSILEKTGGSDLKELYLAEGLAAVHWSPGPLQDPDPIATLRRACAELELDPPAALTPATVDAVRGELARLHGEWRGLLPQGTLVQRFERHA